MDREDVIQKLRDVTLVVHDFGGPIALPTALERPGRVSRLVVINSWMWSFEGDPHIERGSRLFTSRLGRWMYRSLNASIRIITPSAYADRSRFTPRIRAQHLAPFTGIDSRERVLCSAPPCSTRTCGSGGRRSRTFPR